MSDELDDLARSLRQTAGQELRAEAAADEELTEIQRRRRLELAAVARAALHRGDRVSITAGGMTLAHPVIAVGADYLTMDDGERLVDIRLDLGVLEVVPRTEGGSSARPQSATFRARLAELEQEQAAVEIVTAFGARLQGRIDVVAVDHVVIADDPDSRSYVPTMSVAIVFSRRPPRLG